MGVVTAALVASSVLQGAGQIQQSRAQARAARENRRFGEMMAADVETRGQEDIKAYQRQLSQVTGQQRVGLAAQNIDLTQGTAAQIAQQTARIGEQDVATIRRNIEREAWGIRTQTDINYRAGMAQSRASGFAAVGSFIQAGTQFAQSPTGQKWWNEAVKPRASTMMGNARSGWDNFTRRIGYSPLTPMAGNP